MTLTDLIATHRELYRADVSIPHLVARQPPLTVDPQTGERHQEDGAAVGMTLSGRLLRYLGHPEGYGSDFPWSKALWRLKVECRRAHPYHRGPTVPYWRGSLCWQLVVLTIIGKPLGNGPATLEEAGRILRYDNPEPVLRAAFQFIEDDIDHQREKAERRARDDEGRGPGAIPQPVVMHHVTPGMHAEDCQQCLRVLA